MRDQDQKQADFQDSATRSRCVPKQNALGVLHQFVSNRQGAILLVLGLTLPLLIGMLGLGVDVTNWYLSKRQLQTASDAGAIGGAMTFHVSESEVAAQSAALNSVSRNGFAAGTGVTVTVNIPPTSGAFMGDDGAVEVITTEDQTLFFASIIFPGDVNVLARAVAASMHLDAPHCVLALDRTMDAAILVSGTADVSFNCGVASNSDSDESIRVWGKASLEATPLTAYGDIAIGNNAEVYSGYFNANSLSYVDDPYKDLVVPAKPGPCDPALTGLHFSGETVTLDPGWYCDGLQISNSFVTFNPGIYIIEGGAFKISGTSTVEGEDMTIILTGSGSDYASVDIAGGTQVNLSATVAPTTFAEEPYLGILFYQDQNAPITNNANKFLGGSDMNVQGAFYFPSQELEYEGGVTGGSGCIQLVALHITFLGNSDIDITGCDDVNIELPSILAEVVKLVE